MHIPCNQCCLATTHHTHPDPALQMPLEDLKQILTNCTKAIR